MTFLGQPPRRVALIAGLLLVLVPTLFSVFPEWTKWADWLRGVVVAGWAIAAWLVVRATARQSEQVEELVGEPRERRDEGRAAAAQILIRALLRPDAVEMPGGYELRLFLPSEDGTLLPEYESPGSTPSSGWRPGQGATGMAWNRNGLVIARGAAVSDGTYGLTPEQQERYRDLAIVAAHPVQNARGYPLGVLAVSSEQDDGYFDHPDAMLNLVAVCEVVGRILLDIRLLGHD